MIRFFADIVYLFFFLTLTFPLYPLFDHWNKTGQEHRRTEKAQSMIMNAFKTCLKFAGTKVIVDGRENIPEDTAVLYVGNHSSYYDILCSYVATPHAPASSPKMRWVRSLSQPLDDVHQLPVFGQKEY